MRQLRVSPLRLLIAIGALAVLAMPVVPALGQGSTDLSTIKVSIDSPSDGIDVQNGRRVVIGGWAVDTAGTSSNTGVDVVRVYLDGPMDSGKLLGTAKYGNARADVAGNLGNTGYTNSGFDFPWTPQGVGLGQHILFIYAHSSVTDTWAYQTITVNGPFFITPTPTPMAVAAPPPPPQQQQQQQGPNQAGPNPGDGPRTPYGGGYLNNQQSSGGYGNTGYGYGGYGYPGGGYGYGAPPPMGPMGPVPPMGYGCGNNTFSSSASYPVPCGSNPARWQNGAPFLGF